MTKTIPGVFLIESSYRENEQGALRERFALEEILTSTGRRLEHYYIRTAKELKKLVTEFHNSNFRYLHLACHGGSQGIALTYDNVPFAELAAILAPAMNDRRHFLSACSSTRRALARPLFVNSTCNSIVGPRGDIRFHDAILAWALFYSLMSKVNRDAMKRTAIMQNLQEVCDVLKISFNVLVNESGRAALHVIRPGAGGAPFRTT
jgi:hypothetical protein